MTCVWLKYKFAHKVRQALSILLVFCFARKGTSKVAEYTYSKHTPPPPPDERSLDLTVASVAVAHLALSRAANRVVV